MLLFPGSFLAMHGCGHILGPGRGTAGSQQQAAVEGEGCGGGGMCHEGREERRERKGRREGRRGEEGKEGEDGKEGGREGKGGGTEGGKGGGREGKGGGTEGGKGGGRLQQRVKGGERGGMGTTRKEICRGSTLETDLRIERCTIDIRLSLNMIRRFHRIGGCW